MSRKMSRKMKILSLLGILLCLVISTAAAEDATEADEATVKAMTEFNTVMGRIKSLPAAIDDDICGQDWASYRAHMTELAQNIIDANKLIKDVRLYYPIDLWHIYNVISNNPVCGVVRKAADVFDVADTSRVTNEQMMGILSSDDICMCWNIATGRDEPTGYYKDGACRCTYGFDGINPRTGRNDVPWVLPEE